MEDGSDRKQPPEAQQQPGYPPLAQPQASSIEGELYHQRIDTLDPLAQDAPSNYMHHNNSIEAGGPPELGGNGSAMSALTAAAVAAQPASTSTTMSTVPNTLPSVARGLSGNTAMKPPAGKVVESGQEHTGRWTKEEHEAFLAALQLYGKEWKKVAAKVKTRTVVQTRTHAQKYFQKLQKVLEVCLFILLLKGEDPS